MNFESLIGGGLLLTALAFLSAALLFRYYWLPPGGRAALYAMATLCSVSAALTGLGILTGNYEGLFSTGLWGSIFVGALTVGLWTFNATMLLELRRRENETGEDE